MLEVVPFFGTLYLQAYSHESTGTEPRPRGQVPRGQAIASLLQNSNFCGPEIAPEIREADPPERFQPFRFNPLFRRVQFSVAVQCRNSLPSASIKTSARSGT